MTPPAAISGNFADIKLVKTRSVVQMVIEIPIERAKEVTDAFGWPQPGSEIHVAVARMRIQDNTLAQKAKPSKQPAQSRAERARRLCGVQKFRDWAVKRFAPGESWRDISAADQYKFTSDWIKEYCGVNSKSELDPLTGNADWPPAKAFDKLYSEFRQATGKETERR